MILCASIGAVIPSVRAETPLTWADCVALAKEKNPDLLSAVKSFEAASADYRGSYNSLLPNLSLSSSYGNSDSSTARNSRWNASANAGLDVFNMGNIASIRSARVSLSKSDVALILESASVRFALKSAFANLLFAQEEVDVSKKINDLRRRNSDLVTLKYDSGRESKGNMLRSRAESIQSDADLRDAQRSLIVAQRQLKNQLGERDERIVVGTGTFLTHGLPENPSFINLMKENPRVIQQQTEREAARATLASERSSFWPTLSANYSRSANGPTYFPENYHWSASGVLSYPIFGSGLLSNYFGAAAAKRKLEKSEIDLIGVENTVRTDLESSWADWARTVDQVTVQKEFLTAARQRNSEAQVRYSSGLMDFENWQPIVTDLVNFERSYLRAQRDAFIAEAAWEQSMGKTLEEQ